MVLKGGNLAFNPSGIRVALGNCVNRANSAASRGAGHHRLSCAKDYLTDKPENQRMQPGCRAHVTAAGIRRAGNLEWRRLWKVEGKFSVLLAPCQPYSKWIAWLLRESTAGCCAVYWRRNGLELVGKGDGGGGLVDVDLRNDALYTGYARIRPRGCNLVASEITGPV